MGKWVEIIKYSVEDSIHYYFVKSDNFGGAEFYIGIDAAAQKVYFYKFADFSTPSGCIDLVTKEGKMSDSGINSDAVPYALLKAYKAIQNNEFPDRIDYCA